MEEEKIIRLTARYPHDYQWILKFIIVLQLALSICLAGFIYYRFVQIPKPIFFATTEREQIIQPVPLDTPSMSTPALLNWIIEAITNSFSFNYTQLNRHVNNMQQYYNNACFNIYKDLLATDPMFKDMVDKKLILYSVALASPKIIDDVIENGIHFWKFEVKILVSLYTPKIYDQQVVTFNVRAMRVPETESANGVTISNLEKISVGRL